MTKSETELTLLQLGKAMQHIVNGFNASVNHMSLTVINGQVRIDACEWSFERSDYIQKDVLRAVMFADGSMLIGGEYVDG